MLTEQQIFNRSRNHLLKQNCQSLDPESGGCLYRGPNGAKCGIGHLITDDEYNEKMEMRGVMSLLEAYTFKNFDFTNISILNAIQRLHDNNGPEIWPKGFEDIKRDYF